MNILDNLSSELLNIKETTNINKDVDIIIKKAKEIAYKNVDTTLIIRNWLIG